MKRRADDIRGVTDTTLREIRESVQYEVSPNMTSCMVCGKRRRIMHHVSGLRGGLCSQRCREQWEGSIAQGEQWRGIPYPDRESIVYAVSNHGRVINLYTGRMMRHIVNHVTHYRTVVLCVGNKRKMFGLQTLIRNAWGQKVSDEAHRMLGYPVPLPHAGQPRKYKRRS